MVLLLCGIFGWAYGRWSVEHRTLALEVDEQRNLITITNTGRVTEEQVVVIISAISDVEGTLGAHVVRTDSTRPPVMHAAERQRSDRGFRDTTFIYTADRLPPKGSLVLRVTTSEQPSQIKVVASASIASASYTYPSVNGLAGEPPGLYALPFDGA
jgi:hypothetical protein